VVRALETIGEASADLRDSVDPRVTLEVALVRIASPAVDTNAAALLARIEQLEARIAGGATSVSLPAPQPAAAPAAPVPPAPAASAPAPAAPAPAAPAPAPPPTPGAAGPPDGGGARPRPSGRLPRSDRPGPRPGEPRPSLGAPPPMPRPGGTPAAGRPTPSGPPAAPQRPTIGAHRRGAPSAPAGSATPGDQPTGRTPPAGPVAGPGRGSVEGGSLPSRDELTKAWGDTVLPGLPARVKAYMAPGRFVAVDTTEAVFALPDQGLLSRAGSVRGDAEAALAAHFSRPVPLRLVLDDGAVPVSDEGPPLDPDDPSSYDLDDLEDAGPGVRSPEQRLLEAFPGAEEVAQ
jgi:hypothetical protein